MIRTIPRFVAAAAAAASVLAGSAVAAPVVLSEPESAGFSSERLERVDRMLQGYIDRREVPGAVGLIARSGNVVYHRSFGYREVETKAAMTNDVIFRIASMTKPIATVALMMLWEEGHFQLRDPISGFLPEFAEMDVAVPVGPADAARARSGASQQGIRLHSNTS